MSARKLKCPSSARLSSGNFSSNSSLLDSFFSKNKCQNDRMWEKNVIKFHGKLYCSCITAICFYICIMHISHSVILYIFLKECKNSPFLSLNARISNFSSSWKKDTAFWPIFFMDDFSYLFCKMEAIPMKIRQGRWKVTKSWAQKFPLTSHPS